MSSVRGKLGNGIVVVFDLVIPTLDSFGGKLYLTNGGGSGVININIFACVVAYIQQVFWAKKYLPRKNEGFRDPILNSKFSIEN